MNARSVGILSASLLSLLAILSSCQFIPEYSDLPVDLQSDELHTILFSSRSNQEEEKTYYDALLQLQKNYPEQLNAIKVIKKSNDQVVDFYNVNTFPTVIVYDGKDEIIRLEGKKEVDDIKNRLDKVYTD